MGHRVSTMAMTRTSRYLFAAFAVAGASTGNFAAPISSATGEFHVGGSRFNDGSSGRADTSRRRTNFGTGTGTQSLVSERKCRDGGDRSCSRRRPPVHGFGSCSLPCCFVGAPPTTPLALSSTTVRRRHPREGDAATISPPEALLRLKGGQQQRRDVVSSRFGNDGGFPSSFSRRQQAGEDDDRRRRRRLAHLLRQRRWRARPWRERPASSLKYRDMPTDDVGVISWDDHVVEGLAALPVRPYLTSDGDGKIKTRRRKLGRQSSGDEPAEEGMFISIPKPATKPRPSRARKVAATDVTTLRRMFGTNKNKLWGDLDNETARKLYHALLPRALIRLHAQGLRPDELAPIAFEARNAAKQYVRERCQIPGRILAVAYDGLRHLKQYGKWSPTGLSWDELWSKYERQIQEEIQIWDPTLKLEDLTSQVCLRILESSCRSNKMVDRLVMGTEGDGEGVKDLKSSVGDEVLAIAQKLDREVHELLNRMEQESTISAQDVFRLRLIAAAKKRWSEKFVEFQEKGQELSSLRWGSFRMQEQR